MDSGIVTLFTVCVNLDMPTRLLLFFANQQLKLIEEDGNKTTQNP